MNITKQLCILATILAFHVINCCAVHPVFSLSNTASGIQPSLQTHSAASHRFDHNAQLQRYCASRAMCALYHNQQESVRSFASLSECELAHAIANTINSMRQSGYSDSDAERFILSHHHLYGLPLFIASVKQFPGYREYIKALHAQIAQYKSPSIIYAINKRLNALPLGFKDLDAHVQKLYKEIIDQEICFTHNQIEHAQALLDEYDEDLFYQNDARIARAKNRRRALQKIESNPSS